MGFENSVGVFDFHRKNWGFGVGRFSVFWWESEGFHVFCFVFFVRKNGRNISLISYILEYTLCLIRICICYHI